MREPLIYVPAWIWIIFVAAAAVSVFSLFCAARRERMARLRAAIPQDRFFAVDELVSCATPRQVKRILVRMCEEGSLVWRHVGEGSVCRPTKNSFSGTLRRQEGLPEVHDAHEFIFCVSPNHTPVNT